MSDVVSCFDTLTPDALPDGVAFFIDYYGETEVRAQILARFPTAFGISFTFSPADAGALDCWVCDCEQRGYQPDQAAYWAHQRVLMGKRPCVFVEVSMKPELEQALAVYGLEFGRDVDCWLSWWGQPAVIPQGIVETPWGPVATGVGNIGIQYLNNGDAYDESVLDLAWVQTLMPKPPAPTEEPQMFIKAAKTETVGGVAITKGDVFQAIVSGGESWLHGRTADLVATLPSSWIVTDTADGGWINAYAGKIIPAA